MKETAFTPLLKSLDACACAPLSEVSALRSDPCTAGAEFCSLLCLSFFGGPLSAVVGRGAEAEEGTVNGVLVRLRMCYSHEISQLDGKDKLTGFHWE